MKRFIKAVAAAALICCIFIFGLIAYGASALPDEISVSENGASCIGTVFTVNENCNAKPALKSKGVSRYESQITALKMFPVKDITVTVTKRRFVAPGGDAVGIKL